MSDNIRNHLKAPCVLEVRTQEDAEGVDNIVVECTACGAVVRQLYNRSPDRVVESGGFRVWHLRAWEPRHPGKMDMGREEVWAGTIVTRPLGDLYDGHVAVGASLVTPPDMFSRRGGRGLARKRCELLVDLLEGRISDVRRVLRYKERGIKLTAVVAAGALEKWVATMKDTQARKAVGRKAVQGSVRILLGPTPAAGDRQSGDPE